MSTNWTLTATEACSDALQHLGVLDPGETASATDMQAALRALDVVLKELPLAGYSWPKLSAEAALVWIGAQSIALPADYYAYPIAWSTINAQKTPLIQIPHAQWVKMINTTQTAPAPTHFYVSPAKLVYLWPAPTVDPVVTIQYQKIINDSALVTAPDLPQYWLGALPYGVANELTLKFGVPDARAAQIAGRWLAKRAAALENSIASEVISFEARD